MNVGTIREKKSLSRSHTLIIIVSWENPGIIDRLAFDNDRANLVKTGRVIGYSVQTGTEDGYPRLEGLWMIEKIQKARVPWGVEKKKKKR